MSKRILSCMLIVALVLTMMPATVFGATSRVNHGDVNGDGNVDLYDALTMAHYLAGDNPTEFVSKNADMNSDKTVDDTDYVMLKQYLAEWDMEFSDDTETGDLTVKFYDGSRLIAAMPAVQGEPLGEIPTVEETSKADGIFVGWYTDLACTEPFYAENPVTENINVYAKYEGVPGIEETLLIDSFSKTDVDEDYSVTIKGSGDAKKALTLKAKDGTEPPKLKITDNGDNTYTVTAEEGFRAGSSYELTLAEGFNFVGEEGELPESVRTAYFTVKKEIVDQLKMNEKIVYIKDTKNMKYHDVDTNDDGKRSETADVLTSDVGLRPTMYYSYASNSENFPTTLKQGDIICFYTGTHPEKRVYTGKDASAYVNEHATYVKFYSANGNWKNIYIRPLDENDMTNIYDIPDIFPIKDKDAVNKTSFSKLDTYVYKEFGIENASRSYAESRANVGDYVAVYPDTPYGEGGKDVVLGRITEYKNGNITFEKCTKEDIVGARDIYVQPSLEVDKVITEEDRKAIETSMTKQIKESGFAEEAAYTLAELSADTDGFKNMDGLRDAMLLDENGEPLSDDEIEMLNLGASFELKDGVTTSVELITDGDELHYNDGMQLAVSLAADLEVEAEEGKIVIKLNATFIEEVAVEPTVDGSLTYTEIAEVIPVPNGVHVTANVDVLNYTAYDFDVTAYTVEEEDESIWKKVESLAKNPTKLSSVVKDSGLIPAKYASSLNAVGDVFEEIEYVNKEISDAESKYKENKAEIQKLKSDLSELNYLAEYLIKEGVCEGLDTDDWKNAAETFSRTNIAKELLHLTDEGINFDGDAGVENDVNIKSVDELMARYSEMLEQETDWITLVEKTLCEAAVGIKAINLSLGVDFVMRTNMSIAMGSTLEYETGKRYTFWFKFGLYKPTSGTSNMDLIDESMVFQFYVMGKLHIKMGAKLTIGANIGSDDFVHVGIYGEVGPYVKFYGFFIYTYERLREANILNPVVNERKMGAVYLETGIYLIVGAEASAIKDLFEVSKDFVDAEYPIMSAGSEEYPYEFSTEFEEDEKVIIRDEDGNSSTGITMALPKQFTAMDTMTLTTGKSVSKVYDYSNFYVYLSNPNFKLDQKTGTITVDAPEGVRFMNCELRLTYKYGKMAFSDYDMALSIPLYWTNLSTDEQKECYNASVRVGNAQDGYETVWTKRVMKRQPFELPTEDVIRDLIGYDDVKYESGGYAEEYNTSSGIIEDAVYDYNVKPKSYTLTVSGIEGEEYDTKTFTAKYGQKFNFSALEGTGKNDKEKGEYTIFHNVTTDSKLAVGTDANGETRYEAVDLNSPITSRVAQALAAGEITAKANYVDNSVKAFFEFRGKVSIKDAEKTLRKGDTVDISEYEDAIAAKNWAITDITPDIAPIYENTVYFITSGEASGESYTLSFEENGGSEVEDITKIGGSVIGAMPTPEKTGYDFDGWYLDEALETPFTSKFQPKENTTLYAKWTGKNYTVSFHINGGTGDTPEAVTVKYDQPYGELPEAERKGFGFAGWYTEAEGGTMITAESVVNVTADHTLYAHWAKREEISRDVFSFTKPENRMYHKDKTHGDAIQMTYTPEAGATYEQDEFTVEYLIEGDAYENGYVKDPKNAGTYLARITRPGDDRYAKFEETYEAVLTIEQAGINIPAEGFEIAYRGHSAGEHATQNPASFAILDLGVVGISEEDMAILEDCEKFEYQLRDPETKQTYHKSHDGFFDSTKSNKNLEIWLNVDGDQNYKDMDTRAYVMYDGQRYDSITTRDQSDSWKSEWALDWRDGWGFDDKVIEISTAEQLAQIAYWCQSESLLDGFFEQTIKLTADIDLNEKVWIPIGTEENQFHGTFDGNGHTISCLQSGEGGLFGTISNGATIKNLTIKDSLLYGDGGTVVNTMQYVGREFDGSIVVTNCTVDNVLFMTSAGGIAYDADGYGNVSNCMITDCKVTDKNDFRGGRYLGGIAGRVRYTSILNCTNYADIKGNAEYHGGIVGNAEYSLISGCVSHGAVNGDSAVGGIVGSVLEGTISDCTVNGDVSGKENVGEILGLQDVYDGDLTVVENCKFNGKLTVTE